MSHQVADGALGSEGVLTDVLDGSVTDDLGPDALDVLFARLSPSSALASVSFTIARTSPDMALCTLFDGTEAMLPASEWFPSRRWREGERAYGVLTDTAARSLSVTRPELVELLLAGLAPEVRSGEVLIRGVARLPGVRSKVAAASTDPKVDPVAACVGRKANRVRELVEALGGERVDVVAWSPDREELLKAALAPAKVSRVEFDGKRANVFVPAHRMAATVGAGGLNAQLAGRLAGYKVQVFPEQ